MCDFTQFTVKNGVAPGAREECGQTRAVFQSGRCEHARKARLVLLRPTAKLMTKINFFPKIIYLTEPKIIESKLHE